MKTVILLLFVYLQIGFTAKDELVMIMDCICPGLSYNYFSCTITGGLFTVWKGSIFDGDCDITLTNSDFNSSTAVGSCNIGTIIARGIREENGCYTSQLTILPSISLQGQTVECAVNNNDNDITVGQIILNLTREPPPAPKNISFEVKNFNEIIFKWTPLNVTCPAISYHTTTENCGMCIDDISSTVICTNYSKTDSVNICRFIIQSVICGNITGNSSISDKVVNLQVLDPPVVSIVPYYLDGPLPILLRIVTKFEVVQKSFEISDGISGEANAYIISYVDSLSNKMCQLATVSCNSTICSHIYDTSSSSCPSSSNITLTVVAANVIGEGFPSRPIKTAGENNLVDIKFDTTTKSIMCIFNSQSENTIKYCNASIMYGIDCVKTLDTYRSMSESNTVITPPIESIAGVNEYCFSVSASSDNTTIIIEGNLNIIRDGINIQYGEIIAGILVAVIVLTAVTIVITVMTIIIYICWFRRPPPVTIKFTNKKGSLAKILKVFKKNRVNIIRLNTNWKMSDLKRSRDKCQTNYVQFICTNEKKEALINELKKMSGVVASVKVPVSSNQEGNNSNFIAELSVKDKPGALWKVIDTFKRYEINVRGVNITPNCECNTPHYEDNFLSCWCSDIRLKKVVKTLEDLKESKQSNDAICFNIKTVFMEPAKKDIPFWVMGQDGALLRALRVFSDLTICITGVNSYDSEGLLDDCTSRYCIHCNCKQEHFNDLLRCLQSPTIGAEDIKHDNEPPSHLQLSNYCAINFTLRNEVGSLAAALSVFDKLGIKIYGINTHDFSQTKEIEYQVIQVNFHQQTVEQIRELKDTLKARGFVIDRPHSLPKDTPSEGQCDNIQIGIRYKVIGTLKSVIQAFDDLNVVIVGMDLNLQPDVFLINYKRYSIECFATADEQRELESKLLATGVVLFDNDMIANIGTRV